MKYMSDKIKNVMLCFIAILLAICILASFLLKVEFPANETDLLLYRISGVILFAILEIGVLFETNLFNLRENIPLIRSTNIFKHLLFWVSTVILASILFLISYNMTSADFKSQLNKNIVNVDTNSKDVDTTEVTVKTTEQGNDERSNSIETNVNVPENATLTWKLLSKEAERYKLVLTLLGENFNTKTYVDTTFTELSLEEQHLVKDLFDYVNRNNTLPTDFTETFTAFCVGDEFENMFFDGTPNSAFYNSLSNSFVISRKSDDTYYINIREVSKETYKNTDEFIVEESPFTHVFDETEYIVGNCLVVLKKIEIVNKPHKSYGGSSTYAKYIRIQATVKNSSSQKTYLTSKKMGNVIGKYYGNDGETIIGWNDNYKWEIDSSIKADFGWTLKPNQTRDICIAGVFVDSDRLKYNDEPQIDLYFVNEGDTLTLSIN